MDVEAARAMLQMMGGMGHDRDRMTEQNLQNVQLLRSALDKLRDDEDHIRILHERLTHAMATAQALQEREAMMPHLEEVVHQLSMTQQQLWRVQDLREAVDLACSQIQAKDERIAALEKRVLTTEHALLSMDWSKLGERTPAEELRARTSKTDYNNNGSSSRPTTSDSSLPEDDISLVFKMFRLIEERPQAATLLSTLIAHKAQLAPVAPVATPVSSLYEDLARSRRDNNNNNNISNLNNSNNIYDSFRNINNSASSRSTTRGDAAIRGSSAAATTTPWSPIVGATAAAAARRARTDDSAPLSQLAMREARNIMEEIVAESARQKRREEYLQEQEQLLRLRQLQHEQQQQQVSAASSALLGYLPPPRRRPFFFFSISISNDPRC